MLKLMQFAEGLRNYLLRLVQGSNPMVEQANKLSKEMVGSYTDASTSIIALSLADKVSHNNKQLCSKRVAESSDIEHQWACRDVLETIKAIPYHEVFIHSFGDYDTRGL